ncbi:hypothetical protein RJ640_002209 [Escallonia rubra]|uniref:Uncharacterized protein n=1 Tax=Escallonia rubra TaxID=112253 RepID=A0AA88RMK4_9ASTE|nr:hypothetical protein RJ640_002209 [Escallonia rubra]
MEAARENEHDLSTPKCKGATDGNKGAEDNDNGDRGGGGTTTNSGRGNSHGNNAGVCHHSWVMDACICSSVRPFVSGTSFATNRKLEPQIVANMKNTPAVVCNKCRYIANV